MEVEKINSKSINLLEDETDELIRLMSIRFLMGDDKDYINYEEIDYNELYDDLEQLNRDEEDAYFDTQEENNLKENCYTGVQDY
jgi:hypothetical protein